MLALASLFRAGLMAPGHVRRLTDAFLKTGAEQMTGALNYADAVSMASAATVEIGTAASNHVVITGTATITAFGSAPAGATRKIRFAGSLILTHNGATLDLPTGANITTAAGDAAEFRSIGPGQWRCIQYQRASGRALAVHPNSAALEGLSLVADRLPYANGTGTLALATLTAGARSLLALAGTAGKIPYFSATDTATLADIAAGGRALLALASTGANKLPYFSATDTISTADLTAAGRALLDDASAAAMRDTLEIGTIIRRTYYQAGTTHTLNANTRFWFAELVGGGGGGASAKPTAADRLSAGGGGAGGSYIRTPVNARPAGGTLTFAIGGTGAPGDNTGLNNGSSGGSTTLTDGTTIYTAEGGGGGAGGNIVNTGVGAALGGSPVTPSGAEVHKPGVSGSYGIMIGNASSSLAIGGAGGDSPFGSGGEERVERSTTATGQNGQNGRGRGAGGSGAVSINSTTGYTGGTGTAGACIIWEIA